MADKPITDEALAQVEAGLKGVTPGPWQSDTVKSDGDYGCGEDCHTGFQSRQLIDAHGKVIADALNSDVGEVHTEHNEDGACAWDEVAKRNFAHLARMNPETVRSLIARIRAAEAELKRERETASEIGVIAYLDGADHAKGKLRAAEAERDRLRDALTWYGEQARLARLIHAEGDIGRHALAADGGKKARAALEEGNG